MQSRCQSAVKSRKDHELAVRVTSQSSRPKSINGSDLAGLIHGGFYAGGGRVKQWMQIDAHGNAELVEIEKHDLVRRLGIPYRDLRTIDPYVPMPYPSSIMVRPRAICLSVESIRMITTKDECYVLTVPKPGEPSAERGMAPSFDSPFIRELIDYLRDDSSSSAALDDMEHASREASEESEPLLPFTRGNEANSRSNQAASKGEEEYLNHHEPSVRLSAAQITKRQHKRAGRDRELPFELRVVEAALEGGVKELQVQLTELERQAYPTLERLSYRVAHSDLEEVRSIKHAMTHLTTRVRTVRKEVEDLLDDDQDMDDLYLGRRAWQEEAGEYSTASDSGSPTQSASGSPPQSPPGQLEDAAGQEQADSAERRRRSLMRDSAGPVILGDLEEISPTGKKKKLHYVHPHDIEGAEDMLESYFMQLDFMFSRLDLLKERIDDTEDLVEIDLDHRRNELVALTLLVTIVTGAFTFVAMVAGIFGMNVFSGLEALPRFWFYFIAGISSVIAMFFAAVIFWWAKTHHLLFIPSVP